MTLAVRRPTYPATNWLFTLVIIGWGGVIGSTITVLLAGALLWNLVELSRGRLALDLEFEVRLVAAAFAAYFAALTMAELVNYSHPRSLVKIVEYLPFLGFSLFYASLCKCRREDIAAAVQWGAVSGSLATFIFAAFEVVYLGDYRASGGAGNSGPFASISALLYCLCVITAARRHGWTQALAIAAAGCAAGALFLSGMRGLWPVILIGPMIAVFTRSRNHAPSVSFRAMIAGVILIAGMVALSYDRVSQRVMEVAHDHERITQYSDYQNSIGQRLLIWEAGLDLWSDKPLIGHGSNNIPALMAERVLQLTGTEVGYSHFHNFIVTAAVQSGLIGVVAMLAMILVPLWLAMRRQRDEAANFGFAMLLSIHATFVTSGMSNIMLNHDIMDTLFIFGSATASFLIFRRSESGNLSQPLSKK